MPKTNRRRTTHRKRTSQRKRKNVKRGVLHNMRGGFTYNKYVIIIKDQKHAYNSLLPFANNYPTADNVKEVYQRIVDRTMPSDNISIYGKNYEDYVAGESGESKENPIIINTFTYDDILRYQSPGM
jgi:hypothetical protein